MKKIKVSDTIYTNLKKIASSSGKTIEEVVAQKLGTTTQFDRTTKDGVLRRTYYYQKNKYDDVPSLNKFLKKWNKDERFRELWNLYEHHDFDIRYTPTFFRWGSDTHTEKLFVATKGNVKNDRELLRSNK